MAAHLDRSLLPGVALATMLVKPILYLAGRTVSCMWLSCSSVKPDKKRHFPEPEKRRRESVLVQLQTPATSRHGNFKEVY